MNRYRTPWSIALRAGKHYGTVILDSSGDEIATIWGTGRDPRDEKPSKRELEHFGGSEEEWRKEICDTHWESVADLELAEKLVEAANSGALGALGI